jgi:hypothetical protein
MENAGDDRMFTADLGTMTEAACGNVFALRIIA